MPAVLRLGHLVLVALDRLDLLGDPLLIPFKRLVEFLSSTLLMPAGAGNRFATIVGIERTMVNHALEAVFLPLVTLPVYPWPLGRLQDGFDLRSPPVHEGLALSGRDNHKVPGILWP